MPVTRWRFRRVRCTRKARYGNGSSTCLPRPSHCLRTDFWPCTPPPSSTRSHSSPDTGDTSALGCVEWRLPRGGPLFAGNPAVWQGALRVAEIEVHNLVKCFGPVRAVDGVSFAVEAGETYGLLGPNGAGKTTTMRMLAGLSPITSGTARLAGFDVRDDPRAARACLGVVTQSDGLDEELTVRQNLEVFGYLVGLSRSDAARRAAEVLEFFALSARAGDEVDDLSGGMRRRLAIARALMARPRVIILDEPSTGLDPESRVRVWEELASLKQSGVTLLMSTHYMDEAETLCDRLAILYSGRVLDEGTPPQLVARHAGAAAMDIRPEGASTGVDPRAPDGGGSAVPRGGGPVPGDGPQWPRTRSAAAGGGPDQRARRQSGGRLPDPGRPRAGGRMSLQAVTTGPAAARLRRRSVSAIWWRHVLALARVWRVAVTWFAVEPAVVLLAAALGIGRLVGPMSGYGSYSSFVAPGIIVGTAMFHAIFECSWSVFQRIQQSVYETMLTAPVTVAEIVLAELAFAVTRALLSTAAVGAFAAAFGWIPWLSLPPLLLVAVGVGLVFGTIGLLFAALAPTIHALSLVFTLVATPLFFFSGAFFPVDGAAVLDSAGGVGRAAHAARPPRPRRRHGASGRQPPGLRPLRGNTGHGAVPAGRVAAQAPPAEVAHSRSCGILWERPPGRDQSRHRPHSKSCFS